MKKLFQAIFSLMVVIPSVSHSSEKPRQITYLCEVQHIGSIYYMDVVDIIDSTDSAVIFTKKIPVSTYGTLTDDAIRFVNKSGIPSGSKDASVIKPHSIFMVTESNENNKSNFILLYRLKIPTGLEIAWHSTHYENGKKITQTGEPLNCKRPAELNFDL
ncbi:hypothetical protein FIP36_17360 [Salmonella enterica]|nr:hypothetical protein [Salmonella enterica]